MKQAVGGTRDGRGRWRETKTENRRKRENGTAPFLLFRIKRASSSRVLFSIGRARAYYTRSRVPFSLSLSLSHPSFFERGGGGGVGSTSAMVKNSDVQQRNSNDRFIEREEIGHETRRGETRREEKRGEWGRGLAEGEGDVIEYPRI